MSKNALYNLIKIRNKLTTFDIPADINLLKRTHKLGSKYFLFDLPIEKPTYFGDYKLIRHHLSVYKTPIGRLDLKSQYHYTAYFQMDGQEYRLHIYYDQDDGSVSQPLFSRVISDTEFEPVNSDEHNAAFELLARSATKTLVENLRTAQHSYIQILQSKYDVLETNILTLSENLFKNKTKYLSVLGSQIEVMNELLQYTDEPRVVAGKINWLITLQKHVEAMEAPQSQSTNGKDSAFVDRDRSDPSLSSSPQGKSGSYQLTHFKSHKANKQASSSDSKPVKKVDFSEIIQNFNKRYEEYKKLPDKVLIDKLMPFYNDLIEKEWALESKHHYRVTLKDLKDLKELKTNIEQLGVGVLQRLLVANDFEKAPKLRPFYKSMPDSIALFSLQMKRHQLLDFLLKNKIIAINFKDFTVGKTKYRSIIDYCFKCGQTEKGIVDILDVLIKNGGSLLDIESTTGLPYAAILLTTKNHYLHAVLDRNMHLTLNNAMFYRQLNQVLKVVITQGGCTPETEETIKELIFSNTNKIELLKHHVSVNESSTSSQQPEEESLGDEMVRQIEEDPDVRYYKNRIDREIALVVPKLPLNQRKLFSGMANLNMAIVRHSLNVIQIFDEVPSFDEIKKATIKQQLIILDNVRLADELVNLQNTMQIYANNHSHQRDFKKLAARQKEIMKKVDENNEELTNAYTSIKAISKAAAISSEMNKMSDLFKKFGGGSSTSKKDEKFTETELMQLLVLGMMMKDKSSIASTSKPGSTEPSSSDSGKEPEDVVEENADGCKIS